MNDIQRLAAVADRNSALEVSAPVAVILLPGPRYVDRLSLGVRCLLRDGLLGRHHGGHPSQAQEGYQSEKQFAEHRR
jgi:hypothetical protein